MKKKPTDLERVKTFIFLLLLNCLGLSTPNAFSQENERVVDQVKVETFRQDADFSYAVNYEVSDDPLSRIWRWVVENFLGFISGVTKTGSLAQIITIMLFTGVIIFAIIKLFDLDKNFGLYKNRRTGLKDHSEGGIDDIKGIDFQAIIQKAYQNKNYREVVRNYYLFALKQLDDKGVIKWKKGKTNYDYLNEVSKSPAKEEFSSLNHFFEYAVYGEFQVSENLAKSSEDLFEQINGSIK